MTKTFVQRIKDVYADAQATRHISAIRTDSLNHPEVKRVYNAIPAAYKRDPKWDSINQRHATPPTHIYIDASIYSNTVTISLVLNGLENLKDDKRLSRLLTTYLTPEWEAKPTTDQTWSDSHKGRSYEFTKEVPHNTKETHPSVRWLRKNEKVWELNDHMKKPMRIRVLINAYVKEDNQSCRIEVTEVREEIIKTEIKRLVCA